MRITVLFICCAFFSAFGQGEPSAAGKKPIVLFTAGKTKVHTSEFTYLYKKNHQQKPEEFTEAKIEEYLNLYVNFKLKVSEALGRGMDTTKAFSQEFDQYREEIKKPYIAEGDDMDRLVKEAYQRSTEQVRAAHILIMLKAGAMPADTLVAWNKISDVRKKAVAGDDFGVLAKEFSEDPSAKSNDGDLGYFSSMDMVYPFESAAYNTKVGEVSPIIKTRFGYHIIKVADHRQSAGEVEVSHIMMSNDKDDPNKARNTIFEVSDQLKAGRKWEELCKEFSQDPNTKETGGRLRQFGLGAFTAAAPEFEKTAFALKATGEISDPIETKFGWHIIRLEKKIPVPAFKDAQAALSRKIARDDRLQLSKKARLEKIKLQYQFQENADTKRWVMSLADSSLQKGKWNYQGPGEASQKKLCSVVGTNYMATELLEFVRTNQTANAQSPIAYLTQLYDQWTEKLLQHAEEEKLIREKPEFKSMLDEYREGILLFSIMEKEIWNRASNDSLGQKKFYAANLSKYKAGDRVKARIFSTDDKKILSDLKSKMANGDTLKNADLRKLKSVSNFRAYEKGESKVIDKLSWTIATHETELDGVFYLVEVSQLLAPGTKTFDEARASVISDYQDQLEKEWVTELKKKYPVSVNTKGKKDVMKELMPKKW